MTRPLLFILAIIVAACVGSPATSEVVRPSGSSAASLVPEAPSSRALETAASRSSVALFPSPSVPAVGGTRKPSAAISLTGLASFVDPSFGGRYLALPSGPGHLARICSRIHRCIWRRSTDAGPSLAMQRAGRVADVSYGDFAWLCGCNPWAVGLLRVVVSGG